MSHLPDEFLPEDELDHEKPVPTDVLETLESREKGESDSGVETFFNRPEFESKDFVAKKNDRPIQKQKGGLGIVSVLAIISVSNLVAVGIFYVAKEPVKYFLNVPDTASLGKFRQEVTENIDVINQRSLKTESKVSRLENSIQTFGPQIIELQNGIEKAAKENAQLKAEKAQLESSVSQLKEQQKVAKAVAVQKQAEALPPKLTLVSVRNVSGVPFVSLRDGEEKSPLLTKGDVWHDWELTLIDLNARKAYFSVKGKAMELAL